MANKIYTSENLLTNVYQNLIQTPIYCFGGDLLITQEIKNYISIPKTAKGLILFNLFQYLNGMSFFTPTNYEFSELVVKKDLNFVKLESGLILKQSDAKHLGLEYEIYNFNIPKLI